MKPSTVLLLIGMFATGCQLAEESDALAAGPVIVERIHPEGMDHKKTDTTVSVMGNSYAINFGRKTFQDRFVSSVEWKQGKDTTFLDKEREYSGFVAIETAEGPLYEKEFSRTDLDQVISESLLKVCNLNALHLVRADSLFTFHVFFGAPESCWVEVIELNVDQMGHESFSNITDQFDEEL